MKTPFVHNQLVNSIITSQGSEGTGNRCAISLVNLQRLCFHLFWELEIVKIFTILIESGVTT